ncbi:protein EOLA1 isoform X1 [Xyrichtys novacula]|uniref:Protein EOLA1 isoform X1 n=1 Tax=Xyrichtys novacula TaxID=13765 RepID=A0AAV1EVC5_XYRNO|nr:protein EOLA1 isoform X1 [Xyrichtys novacula]
MAILWALKWVEREKLKEVVISSDSAAALEALRADKSKACLDLVIEIQNIMCRIGSEHKVILCWVPVHPGVEGNEKVDLLAKESLLKGTGIHKPLGRVELKGLIQEGAIEEWQSGCEREAGRRRDRSVEFGLSDSPPYAGLVLDGVKTVESRWRPLLAPLENQTLAVHIAQRDWEGEEWKAVLSGPLGMNPSQINALMESGERFGRGVVAGLVDVGETWQCPISMQGEELQHLECSAVLIGLQEKHLTYLSNPRWLKEPLSTRGGRDLWTVEIPKELLP